MSRAINKARAVRSYPPATGFTLLEVMIVVVIITLLAAMAFPAYTNHVVSTNQAAAQQFLMKVGNRQEQAMLDKRSYEAALSDLDVSTPDSVADNYAITVNADNAATPPSFEIVATPVSGTIQEDEPTLRYHSDGTKEPADAWE
jgi:type IV pilus assembly protein PilE